MNHMHIITENGKKMAVLPLGDYKKMLSLLENKEYARDAADAKIVLARIVSGAESLIPSPVVDAILDGTHAVRAWRDYRGMTAEVLAKKAGISRAYLTQIENGRRVGTAKILRALAKALGTGIDALMD